MSRPRKHPRPEWFFSDALLKAFAEAARELPARWVARRFGVSDTAVRRAMKIHNVPSRRSGQITREEAARFRNVT